MLPSRLSAATLTYRVRVTRAATVDAQEYATFIRDENQSPFAARKWLDGLQAELASLTEMPTRFPVIPEAEELGFPYRSFMYHSHRVIYAVREEDQTVIVHLVYHGARKPLTRRELE